MFGYSSELGCCTGMLRNGSAQATHTEVCVRGRNGATPILLLDCARVMLASRHGYSDSAFGTLARPCALVRPALLLRAQDGNTPLHRAVENGHVETVRLLLEQGANVEASKQAQIAPSLHLLSKSAVAYPQGQAPQ